jgi:cyclic pyranopterin phosphate synthase
MPKDGVTWQSRHDILTFEEIESIVRFFVGLGVTKIRLTGGEPTVRKGYVDLIARLAEVPGLRLIGLTTNGTRLATDAGALKDAGLSVVNVSLDTLRQDRFVRITRRPELDRVLAGVEAALAAGLITKINVVGLAGLNDDEVFDFVELARCRPLTIRFIEFMPFLGNDWSPTRVLTSREIQSVIGERYGLQPLPSDESAVSRDFQIEGFAGLVGFVSSVSDSFCSGCSRLRLSADGRLKSCLFLPPAVSIRDLLRSGASDQDLEAAVRACLDGKWEAHPPMKNWRQRDHLTMVQIGG